MGNDKLLFQVEAVSKVFALNSGARQRRRNMLYAIREVTLEIYKGEVFGIIGESGSGKSTLGFALADIAAPTSGTIRFRGKAIDAMSREERHRFRQNVQVVFQDSASALNPRRRVGAILRDSLRLRGVPRPLRADAVARLLVDVGLSVEHVGRYPHQLSGGQRQRVGIARALAMEPEVIIADEPVSALDVSLQGQIINLLLDLQHRLKITIVLISHDIAVVSHVCHRIAVMNDGQIVEMGTPEEIIQNPRNEYTRQLIAAVPDGIGRQRARSSIAYPALTDDEPGGRRDDSVVSR